MTDEKSITPFEDSIWALIFFGLGAIIFMNRSAIQGSGFIIIGAISFFAGCVFVFRILIRPEK